MSNYSDDDYLRLLAKYSRAERQLAAPSQGRRTMTDDLIARLHIIAYECYEQHGPDRWVTAVEEAAAALEAAERAKRGD